MCIYKHRRNIVYYYLVSLSFMTYINTAGASAFCDRHAIIQAYISGDYETATSLNKDCINHYEIKTEKLNRHGSLTGRQWNDILLYGYHICVGSQIAAEMGQLLAAEDMLDTAKRYSRSWPFENDLVKWSLVINLTEGFYLEMIGNRREAERLYRRNQDEYTLGRLAVLAMQQKDYGLAVDWAGLSLQSNPENLTSAIILAAVSDSNSIDQSAADLLVPIIENRNKSNQFMPAYYAEVWWAKIWVEEAGKIGILPSFD